MIYGLIFCIALILLAAALIIADWRYTRRERLLMTKMRGSAFYADMYHMVRFARKYTIDQVRIERTRILFTAVVPSGKLCEYKVRGLGTRMLSNDRTRVLAEVLGEDIPVLNSSRYTLHRYRVMRPNGEFDYGYVYTLRASCKAALVAQHSEVLRVN